MHRGATVGCINKNLGTKFLTIETGNDNLKRNNREIIQKVQLISLGLNRIGSYIFRISTQKTGDNNSLQLLYANIHNRQYSSCCSLWLVRHYPANTEEHSGLTDRDEPVNSHDHAKKITLSQISCIHSSICLIAHTHTLLPQHTVMSC